MSWKADSLQGVLFTTPGTSQLDAQQVWEIVADGLPENVQRPAAVPNALSIAAGAYRGYRLIVQSQLGRVDWILNAVPPPTPPEGPPQIDSYEEASSLIGEMLLRSVDKIAPTRLALVGEFGRSFNADDEVSDFLSVQTGGMWFPQPTQDAIYQVNARKAYAGDESLLMNRIVTWSGSTYHLYMAQMPSNSGFGGMMPMREVRSASLKVDVNSATSHDLTVQAESIVSANRSELIAIAQQGLSYLK